MHTIYYIIGGVTERCWHCGIRNDMMLLHCLTERCWHCGMRNYRPLRTIPCTDACAPRRITALLRLWPRSKNNSMIGTYNNDDDEDDEDNDDDDDDNDYLR